MSGNDFADFLLDESTATSDPLIPATFISEGRHTMASEFTELTPALFKYETPSLPTGTKYRMRGYYTGGSTYEFWITTDRDAANPSGNPLVGVVVDSIVP